MFKNLPEHPPFNLAFLMLSRSPHELDLEKLPPNIFAQLAGDLRTNYIYLEISSRPKDSESAIIGGGLGCYSRARDLFVNLLNKIKKINKKK